MYSRKILKVVCAVMLFSFLACKEAAKNEPVTPEETFYYGADLSYVNQILDHGGVYKDNGVVTSPYKIFKDHGTNVARFRLWHNPTWTKTVYNPPGDQMYNDLADVEKAMTLAKAQGMAVELDFHYSDSWADPGKQEIPAAWTNIQNLAVLKDSVYNYTYKTLAHMSKKGLTPDMVQVGNEINCGTLLTNAPAGFPTANACSGQWSALGVVLNAGIKAIRDIAAKSPIQPKILLHVADPKNVEWWFDNVKSQGGVTDFDVVGFSYYPLWHTTVTVDQLSESVKRFKTKYGKAVMILETAYPWTTQGADSYNNAFGTTPITGYPFTQQGQLDMLNKITAELKEGGGTGVFYWEPAWITSNLKDKWGTGSSWENCAMFDFTGNTIISIDYTKTK
jgi:arabinogalactan endo-1,4-beta-galactosidase